jgi:hypothetical protein
MAAPSKETVVTILNKQQYVKSDSVEILSLPSGKQVE